MRWVRVSQYFAKKVRLQLTPKNVKTQCWIAKTVWQRIPGRRARNSKTPMTKTVQTIARNDQLKAYLSRHIKLRDSVRTLRSATSTRLSEPFASTAFAKRAFRCSAPATWNSLPRTVTDSNSIGTFKSRLKHFCILYSIQWTQTLSAASASEVTT